jgi:hypothetical protein
VNQWCFRCGLPALIVVPCPVAVQLDPPPAPRVFAEDREDHWCIHCNGWSRPAMLNPETKRPLLLGVAT